MKLMNQFDSTANYCTNILLKKTNKKKSVQKDQLKSIK